MKLIEKQRDNSKVYRRYDTAQTPFQRLCAIGTCNSPGLEKLNSISEAIDPVRLLKQIAALQDALWQHAVFKKAKPELSENYDSGQKYDLCFKASHCVLTEKPVKNNSDNGFVFNITERNKRKYRKTKKDRGPRWWRTRKDPFEEVWDEMCKWMESNPERTAKSLLIELQQSYPGQYNNNQLRTLQRRVQKWRTQSIVTFDAKWLEEDLRTGDVQQPQLRAIMLKE